MQGGSWRVFGINFHNGPLTCVAERTYCPDKPDTAYLSIYSLGYTPDNQSAPARADIPLSMGVPVSFTFNNVTEDPSSSANITFINSDASYAPNACYNQMLIACGQKQTPAPSPDMGNMTPLLNSFWSSPAGTPFVYDNPDHLSHCALTRTPCASPGDIPIVNVTIVSATFNNDTGIPETETTVIPVAQNSTSFFDISKQADVLGITSSDPYYSAGKTPCGTQLLMLCN